jgi:hypothetical protein
MPDVGQALKDVKELYVKVLGTPAPQVDTPSFLAFPPGVDPLRHAVEEVELLKQLSQQVQQPPAWIPRADLFAGKGHLRGAPERSRGPPGAGEGHLSSTTCIVTGERRPPEPEALRPLNVEMPYGRFERHFPVPLGLKPEHLTARWMEGMLELRLILEPAAAKITPVDVLLTPGGVEMPIKTRKQEEEEAQPVTRSWRRPM